MSVKKILLIAFLVIVSVPGYTQIWKIRRVEISGGAGTSHFFGDIGGFNPKQNYLGARDLSIFNTGVILNASARYRITYNLAVRTSFSGGLFRSSDKHGSNKGRGYQSSTPFFEPALFAEYYFVKNRLEDNYLFVRGYRTSRYPPRAFYDYYVFAGIGGLGWNVNPNLELAYKIRQGKGFDFVVPAGAGVTRIITNEIKAGLELGGRYVLADLPDGYSGLGSGRDIYYFLTMNLTWKIRSAHSGFRH